MSRLRAVLLVPVLGGVLLSTSLVGHAGVGELLGLVVLRRHAAAPVADLAAVLPRWSRWAAGSVAVLAVTGTFASLREVRELDALISTTYGRLLLVKPVLVAGMLALGALGRSWVRRHYAMPVVHGAAAELPTHPSRSRTPRGCADRCCSRPALPSSSSRSRLCSSRPRPSAPRTHRCSARPRPRIVWTAAAGNPGVKAGELDEFEVSVGPLPEAERMVFKALQTYANGEVVRWIEEPVQGQEEPEHPAPVLELVAAEGAAGGRRAGGGGRVHRRRHGAQSRRRRPRSRPRRPRAGTDRSPATPATARCHRLRADSPRSASTDPATVPLGHRVISGGGPGLPGDDRASSRAAAALSVISKGTVRRCPAPPAAVEAAPTLLGDPLVRRARPLLLVPALLISLTSCGDDSGTSPSDAAPTSPAAAPTAADSPATSASPSATAGGVGGPSAAPRSSAADKRFTITFADGRASGDTGRLKVALGDSVSITVTSQSADEVHLHGYDVLAPVSANMPAVLTFEAKIPGVFELELEDLGVQLASLQVQ
jgi:hypothetical protein